MSSPFLGEVRLFAGNFAPRFWSFCNGQILPISQNTALFSLLGTYYGGNGTTTFALPNFQDRVPVHQGQGPGLSPYEVGQTGGSASVTLNNAIQLPIHTHTIHASTAPATTGAASPATSLAFASTNVYGAPVNMAPMWSQVVGGNLPHENRQPFLSLTFIIAVQGIFPARN
jgi:microcystin-dependent protein